MSRRLGPLPGDQVTVPAQQRLRGKEESIPRHARQQPRERDQQDTVPVAQIGPVHLTVQNGDLMPERENLNLLGPMTAPDQDQDQDQESEETTEDEAEEGPLHKVARMAAASACSSPGPAGQRN